MRRKLAAWAVGAGLVGSAHAADTTVLGCNERLAGEVGVRAVVADVGDTVMVPVTVHTTAPLDAFGLKVSFPSHLLSLVTVGPGNLTAENWTISSSNGGGAAQFGGFSTSPIPAGTTGQLGVLRFAVIAAGVDSFTTGSYVADLVGYVPCESVHAPTPVEPATFGRIKALYR